MLVLLFRRTLQRTVALLCFLCTAEGQRIEISNSNFAEQNVSIHSENVLHYGIVNSTSISTVYSEASKSTATSLFFTSPLSELQSSFLHSASSILPSVSDSLISHSDYHSATPEIRHTLPVNSDTYTFNYQETSAHPVQETYISESNMHEISLLSSLAEVFGETSAPSNIHTDKIYVPSVVDPKSSSSSATAEASLYSHFHTPLMSLLVASTSIPFPSVEASISISRSNISPESLITSTSNNESSNTDASLVPADVEHKKLLMLVLKAEDCSRFSKSDFEKMLGKLMAKFGFGDVVPEVSNAKCYSHLNINVTVGGSTPTLRFLPNIDGKNNFTVDVLNRTFRIVKLEKVDLKFEKSKSSNTSSNFIAAIAKHESIAYIAVGVSFGLVLIICISVCCIKCCCLRKSQKRFGAPKGTHVRLRPEDYTLTPIPRPTSLYVDYYRGSVTADIYSTTSAGSIASTTPTVEQGVVQPFDTSIVPLEDSSALPLDSSRDPSVESVPVQSDLKTFNIHSLSGKALRNTTDSKEQLNPKHYSKKVETKASGVANPTFQRY